MIPDEILYYICVESCWSFFCNSVISLCFDSCFDSMLFTILSRRSL